MFTDNQLVMGLDIEQNRDLLFFGCKPLLRNLPEPLPTDHFWNHYSAHFWCLTESLFSYFSLSNLGNTDDSLEDQLSLLKTYQLAWITFLNHS